MSVKITAVKGMNDIAYSPIKDTPSITPRWLAVEQALSHLMHQYGYQQIRLPIIEKTALFKRAIGEVTDIEKKCTLSSIKMVTL